MNECKADRWSFAFPSNVSMAVSCLSRRLLPSRGVCSKRGRPFRDALCVLIRGRNVLTRWKWSNVSGNRWPNAIDTFALPFFFFIQDKYMFKQLENIHLFLICISVHLQKTIMLSLYCVLFNELLDSSVERMTQESCKLIIKIWIRIVVIVQVTIHLSIIQTSLKLYST